MVFALAGPIHFIWIFLSRYIENISEIGAIDAVFHTESEYIVFTILTE
jgi:hypothetical protein